MEVRRRENEGKGGRNSKRASLQVEREVQREGIGEEKGGRRASVYRSILQIGTKSKRRRREEMSALERIRERRGKARAELEE